MPDPNKKPKGLLDREPLYHPLYPPAPEPEAIEPGSEYPKHVTRPDGARVTVNNRAEEEAALAAREE